MAAERYDASSFCVNILSVRLAAIMASLLVLPPICGIMRSPDPSFGMESIRIRSAAYRQCTALVTMAFLFFFFLDYTQFFISRFHPFARLETSLRVGEKSLRVGSLIRSLNRFFESTNNQRSVTASDFYFIVVITTVPRWARQIFIAAMNYEKGSQRIVETGVTDSPTPPRWGHISQLSE